MTLVPKFVPPDPRARIVLHPTVTNKQTFLAFAEYVDAKDQPDYAFNMLVAQLEVLDPAFKVWRAANPNAGTLTPAKPGKQGARKGEGKAA